MSGNPMRWNCEKRGCFNAKKRPKIEVFSSCFTRGVNFGDVDAEVECSGLFLRLEWKPACVDLNNGQARSLKAFTELRFGNLCIVIAGDAETMRVFGVQTVFDGKFSSWNMADASGVKQIVKKWWRWADRQ